MSDDDPPGAKGTATPDSEILQKLSPVDAGAEKAERPRAEESRFAGLRDLAKQKEKWSNLLRWILIVSFVLQILVLVAVFFGAAVDEWTTRGVLLQFTAMFIAALRYLFK